MEPHVTLAYLDEHQRLNVWTASQSPSYVRTELATTFSLPMNRIRVRVPYLGGGYGADPVAFRLQPALEEGETFVTGTLVYSFGIKEAIRQAAHAIEWSKPKPAPTGTKRRGKGIAAGVKAVLTPSISGAIVIMNADGTANVLSSTVEMGQGSEATLGQIVAEELGISFDQVHIVQPDTDVTPYDTITAGSRSTYHMGNAVRAAAGKIKAELCEVVAAKLEVAPDDLVARNGRISVRGTEARGMSIGDIFLAKFGSLGTTLVAEAVCQPTATTMDPGTGQSEKCTEYWFPSATAAEVEVDTETGRVTILQLFSVGDTGTAINPKHCEQQLQGAAVMHVGLTLFEEMIFDQGQLINGSLLDYQIVSFKDMPQLLQPIVVQVPHESGPFGAKGAGETGALMVAPAIANAIADAVGVRLRDLPLTPEKVLRALADQQGTSAPKGDMV